VKEKIFGPKVNLIGPLALNLSAINCHLPSIMIDAGADHKLNLPISLSIGDNDSSVNPMDIKLNPKKDASDYKHALELLPSDCDSIFAHGLIGGRLDHQLFIIGDTHQHLMNHHRIFHFYDQYDLRLCYYPAGEWELNFTGVFSLLTIHEQNIVLKGDLQYPSEGEYTHILPLTSLTLSNISFGRFKLINQRPIGLYFKDPNSV
jgi:thiamine pyrophosphokinase